MRNNKHVLLWTAIVLLMTSAFFPAVFAQSIDSNYLTDVNNHWAQHEIMNYVEKGFLKGYDDHTFKPDEFIKRSEFVTVINKVFGFHEKEGIGFKDVSEESWYYDEISQAKYIGYVNGDNQGYFHPDRYTTRQEAAAIIARIHDLGEDTTEDELNFSDKSNISDWAVNNVKAVVQKGYIKGYSDNTFKSQNNITRSEAAVLISRVSGEVYNAEGNYGRNEEIKTIRGNVTVACTGVNLSDLHIKGDLYLTEGIGDGEVSLDNVKVDGKTIIKGGGPDSILIINSDLNIVVINTKTGQVRVLAKGDTKIDNVVVSSSAKLEEEELTGDGFGNCFVNVPEGEEVIFAGEFKNVEIDSPNMNLNVASGNIEDLTISDKAENTNIEVGKNATIGNANIKAAAKITGEGKIDNVNIESDDVDIDDNIYKEETTLVRSGGGSTSGKTKSVVSAISVDGDAVVGGNLTAVDLEPEGADVDYQWRSADAEDGTYEDIDGATDSTYTLTEDEEDEWIKVVATGTGDYAGEVISNVVGPVAAADLSGFDVADPGDQVEGEAFNLDITNATDVDGNDLDGNINVTVTSDTADGEVFNSDVKFSDGAATVEDITLTTVDDHELTVDVAGVTEDEVIEDVTVVAAPTATVESIEEVTDGDTDITTTVNFDNTDKVYVDLEDDQGNSLTADNGEVERTEDGEFTIELEVAASTDDEIHVVVYNDAELTEELDSDSTTVVVAPPSATVRDVTIDGTLGESIDAKEVVITIKNDEIASDICEMDDLSHWFTNLPDGLNAESKDFFEVGATEVTIEVFGTPSKAIEAPLSIEIPHGQLVLSSENLVVEENVDTRFEIIHDLSGFDLAMEICYWGTGLLSQ